MIILGVGLAGALCGALNKDAQIYESGDNKTSHQALLRFRSPDIGEALGIPFKEVKVYKAIWYDDHPAPLTPRMIALYSMKVTGTLEYRSITNLTTESRWIAPDDFLDQLKQQCYGRIVYGVKLNRKFITDCQKTNEPIISTIPISVLTKLIYKEIKTDTKSNFIYVNRYQIFDCNLYMTNYYPSKMTNCYRASINGDILIIESMDEIAANTLHMVLESFGIKGIYHEELLINHKQYNGKIIPIDELTRRRAIVDLTIDHNIFSLGRFATWRNILLDDVYKDILVIKQLINKDKYHIIRSI